MEAIEAGASRLHREAVQVRGRPLRREEGPGRRVAARLARPGAAVTLDVQKYLSLYVGEAGEHLAAFGKDLVRLEEAARQGGGDGGEGRDRLLLPPRPQREGDERVDGARGDRRARPPRRGPRRRLPRGPGPPRRRAPSTCSSPPATGCRRWCRARRAASPRPPTSRAMERLAEAARRLRERPRGSTAAPARRRRAPARPPRPAAAPARPRGAGAPRPGGRRDRGSCPVPAVRAFLVVKKLAALGAVAARDARRSTTSRRAASPARSSRSCSRPARPLQAVERALAQISDLAGGGAPRAQEEERAAPAPAPRRGRRPARRAAPCGCGPRSSTASSTRWASSSSPPRGSARWGGRSPQDTAPPLDEGVDRLHAIVKDLHDKVMTVRMTPLALVTERLPRAARDVARKLGKQIEVEVKGAEIELDRAILEELSDPLLHVLRNAVDHGIEPPHLRLLAGKPATGPRHRPRAPRARPGDPRGGGRREGDGPGEAPRRGGGARRAHRRAGGGARRPRGAAARLPARASPPPRPSPTSPGRGVGLDAVKRTVEAVGGTLEIDSAPGVGTRVTLRLPLTVAVQPVLLVRVARRGARPAHREGARRRARRDVPARPEPRRAGPPLRRRARPGARPRPAARLPLRRRATSARSSWPTARDGRIGLAVDALLGQHEAVLKPLGAPLDAVAGLSAVTVLGNGRPVFILDVQRLARRMTPLRAPRGGRAAGARLHRLRPGHHRARQARPAPLRDGRAGGVGRRRRRAPSPSFLGGARPGPRRGGREARGAAHRRPPARPPRARRGGPRRAARLSRRRTAGAASPRARSWSRATSSGARSSRRWARSSGRSSSSRCRRFARGSGRACVERLVAHAGSVALATRFSACAEDTGAALEGLILVMPEPERIARLLSHLEVR